MTPDGEDADRPGARLDAALARFKPRAPDADTTPVSDDARAGMTWNPVTDTGAATDTQPRSSFQFDLGSALARLGTVATPDVDPLEPDPAADPLPIRARLDETVSDAAGPDAPPTAPPTDPLPTREPEPLPTRARTVPPDQLPTRERATGSTPGDPLPTRTVEAEPSDPRARDDVDIPATATRPMVVDRLPTRTPRSEPRSEPSAPATTPVATAHPATAFVPTATSPAAPATSPAAPAPSGGDLQPSNSRRSVFDDANPTPTLPTVLTAASPSAPAAPATVAPEGVPFLPTLPVAAPAAPPPVVAPIESAPSTPQLNALRSAQLRAGRNDRQGKLVGRALLGLVVVGAIVAAALLFGRSYLFPTEWSAELTPLVDEIQGARGLEFDETLALVERPASEYAPLVTAHVLGSEWSTRLPEWRALGIAAGDGSVADVQVRIAALHPVFYDPAADQLVASADSTTDSRAASLRLALETALAAQLAADVDRPEPAMGLTGLDPIGTVARHAYDAAATDLVANAPDAVDDLTGVPLPVAYRLRAVDQLGSTLTAGVTTPRPADPLPAAALSQLVDTRQEAVGGLLQPGDQQVLEPVALGTDDWALIWGARLPPATVGRMVDSLTADSYAVVNRSGATCFVAVFETAADGDGAALLADLGAWVVAAPEGTGAATTQLGPTRTQLEACDPGADVITTPALAAIDLVLSRQVARLSAS